MHYHARIIIIIIMKECACYIVATNIGTLQMSQHRSSSFRI